MRQLTHFFFFLLPEGEKPMNHSGMPVTWEEIKELGLDEVPPGYEPAEDEEQHQNGGKEHDERQE